MITAKNLTKIYKTYHKTGNIITDLFQRQYKDKKALDNISFDITEDELVGFIGPNGAGKTTTMKILSGILYPTSGLVEVLRFTPSEKEYAFLKQIAFVMGHKNQLLWELPAMDSFKLNKEIYEIDDRTFKNTVNELIELLQAEKLINQPVKTLSLGKRMRMELIASLLHKPKILFLDEPTIVLDIFAQTTIINFIKEYQKRYNSTIMLTSHYMQDVQRLAKRLIMINHGRIIFDGLLQDLVAKYSQQKMVHITLLKPLPKDFETPEEIKCEYNFPQLRINTQKEHIAGILSYMLKKVEFTDVTIEDEPIEEIIKKIFTSSQNTVSPPK